MEKRSVFAPLFMLVKDRTSRASAYTFKGEERVGDFAQAVRHRKTKGRQEKKQRGRKTRNTKAEKD
jgi:hypothetical protein